MDFGIAKVLEHAQGKTTQSLGTLQYMSPEQIDARAVDARTDLYALGLLLYEMLTGEPPFRSASPRELLNLQCTAEPPPFGDEVEAPEGVCAAAEVLEALSIFRVGKKRKPVEGAPSVRARRPRVSDAQPDGGLASLAAVTPSGTLRSPRRLDTIALLERASAPREVRVRTGILVIALAAILSGGVTYGVRARGALDARSPPNAPAHASVSARDLPAPPR
jgi:serine/threonine-protein kinase